MLETVLNFLTKVLDQIKYFAAAFFIRRATQIEVNRDELAQENDVKQKQLEISAAPADSPDVIRQRMRDGDL